MIKKFACDQLIPLIHLIRKSSHLVIWEDYDDTNRIRLLKGYTVQMYMPTEKGTVLYYIIFNPAGIAYRIFSEHTKDNVMMMNEYFVKDDILMRNQYFFVNNQWFETREHNKPFVFWSGMKYI